MADDINTAINSGGYVIVPEKAVDGTGKDAIYVYMTYNSNGNQAWKISGGLNGGVFDGSSSLGTVGFVTALMASGKATSLLLTILKIIFTTISKWLNRLLNILNIFKILSACSDEGKPEQLEPLIKFFGCWIGEYILSVVIGAILTAFIPVVGPVLLLAVIMALVTHFIIDYITQGSLDDCQQEAIKQCENM